MQAFLPSPAWLLTLIPPLVRKLDRRHTGRLKKIDKPTGGRSGCGRSKILRRRESLVLYKSFDTLCCTQRKLGLMHSKRCYITVDSAMAASLNGLFSILIPALYLPKKNQYYSLFRTWQKTFYNLYSFHVLSKSSCDTRSLYYTMLELYKHAAFCDTAVEKSTIM
jgi:hypothetical protein